MNNDLSLYTDYLLTTDFFWGIERDKLLTLLEAMNAHIEDYPKGEVIVRYDDVIREMGVILEGVVHVEVDDADGHQINLSVLGQGEEFGAFLAASWHPRSWMNVWAGTPCKVLFVDIADLHSKGPKTPEAMILVNNLLSCFAQRCVDLYQRVALYGHRRVRSRIRLYLIGIADGGDEVVLPLNRTQLAIHLGVERTALARELSHMQKEGIIAIDRRHITLLDKEFFRHSYDMIAKRPDDLQK